MTSLAIFCVACDVLLVICAAADGRHDGLPAALLAMQEARRSLFSGEVRWSRESAHRYAGREFQYVSRYAANGDHVFEERGDQEGWVEWSGNKPVSRFPQIHVANELGVFLWSETDVGCDYWRPNREVPAEQANPLPERTDIRWLGTHPNPGVMGGSPGDYLWMPGAALGDPLRDVPLVVWRERSVGVNVEVCAEVANGQRIVWIIDPDRDWNPVRVEYFDRDGGLVVEVINELQQCKGGWFPRTVSYVRGGRRIEIFRVAGARFNQPDDPMRFSLEAVGIEPGTNVVPQNFRAEGPILFWNGDALVNRKQWDAQVRSGERDWGPSLKAFMRSGGGISPYLTDEQRRARQQDHDEQMFLSSVRAPLSDWERYVLAFIARYGLNDDQAQRAYLVLGECQRSGAKYLDRQKASFYRLHQRTAEARQANDTAAMQAASRELRRLREPVEHIFEQDLKPRLHKLLTRAQRELTAASQPSERP
jgi:hypothetical protein